MRRLTARNRHSVTVPAIFKELAMEIVRKLVIFLVLSCCGYAVHANSLPELDGVDTIARWHLYLSCVERWPHLFSTDINETHSSFIQTWISGKCMHAGQSLD